MIIAWIVMLIVVSLIIWTEHEQNMEKLRRDRTGKDGK